MDKLINWCLTHKIMRWKLWENNAKSRKYVKICCIILRYIEQIHKLVIVFGPVSTFSRISWREGKKVWYKLDVIEADANISNVCNCQSVKRLSSRGMISLTDHRWLRTNVSRTEPWNKYWTYQCTSTLMIMYLMAIRIHCSFLHSMGSMLHHRLS